MRVDLLIPALNEEKNMPSVLGGAQTYRFRRIVVADNGSTDRTADVAERAGAIVVNAPQRGYGSACLAGLNFMRKDPPDVVMFMDGDGADDPSDIEAVLQPIFNGEADLVIGSRTRGQADPGALTPVQRFGNALSCTLLRLVFGVHFTDLGPFRAVRWPILETLDMADRDFGWTVEMQAKAARKGIRCHEVPVTYRVRHAGQSKVSGNIKGSIQAGIKILYTIGVEALKK